MPLALDVVDTFDLTKQKPAHIMFHTGEKHLPKRSEAEGRYVSIDVDFVTVRQPGGTDSVIYEVQHWFDNILPIELSSGRLNPAHAKYYKDAYQRWKEGQEMPVEGTPIRSW